MEAGLTIAVVCLSVCLLVMVASVPLLYCKCFRLEQRLDQEKERLQKQIDTLDETVARLLANIIGEPPGAAK